MSMVIVKQWLRGFTLVELLICVAVLAVIIGLLLPALIPHHHNADSSARVKCRNNLKQVGLAFRLFAVDHQDRFPMQVSTNDGGTLELVGEGAVSQHFLALSNELVTPLVIICPADKKRSAARAFSTLNESNVSYFVGLDSSGRSELILSGDRNVTTNGRLLKAGIVNLPTNSMVGWSPDIHNLMGQIAMGDGSVQQLTASRLMDLLWGTGLATNRLVVP